jgi:hypothetical protein
MYVNNPQFPPLPPKGGVDPGRKRKMVLYGGLTGVLICITVLFGLSAAGVLRLQSIGIPSTNLKAQGVNSGPTLLSAQTEDGTPILVATNDTTNTSALSAQAVTDSPPVLQARTEGPPAALQSLAPTKTGMPADVRDWLEHLRKTEERRASIATDQVSEALTMLTSMQGGGDLSSIAGLSGDEDGSTYGSNKPTAQQAAQTDEGMRQQWVSLLSFFNSKKAPAECVTMRNQYDQVVRETGTMIMEIIDIAQNASADTKGAISRLQSMMGKSKNRIDVPAAKVDDGVKEICRKYDTTKWFDIKPDFGGGLTQKLGL